MLKDHSLDLHFPVYHTFLDLEERGTTENSSEYSQSRSNNASGQGEGRHGTRSGTR
jgi:hypothetical protein